MPELVSLTTSVNESFAEDVEACLVYMRPLQARMCEEAAILQAAYKSLNMAVTMTADTSCADHVSLNYTFDHFPNDKDYMSRCIALNDSDEVEVFTDYLWSVNMDLERSKFVFEYNSPEPEVEEKSDNNRVIKGRDFPLTAEGYQQLVTYFTKVLKHFVPLEVQIECHQEYSRRQYQQMLNFVVK